MKETVQFGNLPAPEKPKEDDDLFGSARMFIRHVYGSTSRSSLCSDLPGKLNIDSTFRR